MTENAIFDYSFENIKKSMLRKIVRAELEKAARGTNGACGHFFRIEDILVQKSCTYVEIAELCGDINLF